MSRKNVGRNHTRVYFFPYLVEMKKILILVSAIFFNSLTLEAKAQTPYSPIIGPWQFRSNQTSDGLWQCQMVTYLPNRAGLLSINISDPSRKMSIFLEKSGWDIPDGTQVPIDIVFEKHGLINFMGYGKGDAIIIIPNEEQKIKFLIRSTFSKNFILHFIKGNEGVWFVTGKYMKEAMKNMSTCLDYIHQLSQPPTQPY
ncbi:hypothetical protein [Acetobacter pomorum]|nr:hypothetical protein [Acetobacter pomorum]